MTTVLRNRLIEESMSHSFALLEKILTLKLLRVNIVCQNLPLYHQVYTALSKEKVVNCSKNSGAALDCLGVINPSGECYDPCEKLYE